MKRKKIGIVAVGLLTGLFAGGCNTNTRIDDTAYRAVGQSTPRAVQPSAIQSNPAQPSPVQPPSVQTRPAQPYSLQQHPVADAAGQLATQHASALPQNTQASQNSPPGSSPTTTDIASAAWKNAASAIPSSQDSAQQHVVRYGNTRVIDKIARIMQIHCQPLQHRISTDNNSFWNDSDGILHQCDYRFPDFCGGHPFSLLRSGDKQALVYKPKDETRYVIDTLKGTPKSQSGLWDQDDHIGSGTTNAGYFFTPDYNQPSRQQPFNPAILGWIIKASHQDEDLLGRQYHQAVNDVTRCF